MSEKLKLYEPVEFIHDHLLDKLELEKTDETLAFHVTCTSTKMGLQDKFITVARACTENPVFPEEVGCCGFAGDKGFTQPEINTWALRNLKLQVDRLSAGYSNSRTCEIGLSRNSGIDYKSVMYLVQGLASKNKHLAGGTLASGLQAVGIDPRLQLPGLKLHLMCHRARKAGPPGFSPSCRSHQRPPAEHAAVRVEKKQCANASWTGLG